MTIDFDSLTDGSAKVFGMENFGNTCYCNSILQCLYYSKPFRENILNFPPNVENVERAPKKEVAGETPHPFTVDPAAARLNTSTQGNELGLNSPQVPAGMQTVPNGDSAGKDKNLGRKKSIFKKDSTSTPDAPPITPFPDHLVSKAPPAYKGLEGLKLGVRFPGQNLPVVGFTEDPFGTPESRKRAALVTGPIVNLDYSFAQDYGMRESLFTGLKDIFESMSENESRVGVVSPSRLIHVLKRDNEPFRSSMHQDAHEFFNYMLNEVIENVDFETAKLTAKHPELKESQPNKWIHDLFEGQLTSETKCLTCENVSRRNEQFMDLSIDLDKNTSVTSCLRQFSESEMLSERNKFHCDNCGGLQEAEKRLKVKKLPKILALHLKRFKFTEDMQRNVKLFHKVNYPKHFRLFNTTDDAQDPDRLYELSGIVVHIGGGPYHGHYVAVVKTEHAGWLLFDDEMVESVDPGYVFNFFGDSKTMATAYVLFYQEISADQMEKENLYTNEPAFFDEPEPETVSDSPPNRSQQAINEEDEEAYNTVEPLAELTTPGTSAPVSRVRTTNSIQSSSSSNSPAVGLQRFATVGAAKETPKSTPTKKKGLFGFKKR
ncbi:hypothetical protein TRVA0_021S01464 [Trichomonascus vanleenenianus]|uniref:uncharacterized protein n=1 Tax=Trichomonascus vanleenenianus TaxID=2268995 RepID=UPI003ECB5C04